MDQVLVAPAQIENELQRIWDSLQGTNKMRACLFNLIIFARKSNRIPYLRSIAQKIIERFPSRIIFVELNSESKESLLETSVSVMTADEGSNEIVCDLINIRATGSHLERIPFVILPHILPDLPIYLLHGHDPVNDDSLSKQIEKFATRIIFDSETTENLPAFAKTLLAYQKQTDIADLNWARIENWRDLMTETFYSTDRLLQLRRARLIHIHYNSESSEALLHTKTQAIYLQGWIASQLGWTLEKHDQGNTFYYDQCTIYLHPTSMKSLAAGRVISIQIETSEEETFNLTRHLENSRHVSIEISTKDTCSIPCHTLFDTDEIGQSTVHEVTHRGTSRHYMNLLSLLSKIEGAL